MAKAAIRKANTSEEEVKPPALSDGTPAQKKEENSHVTSKINELRFDIRSQRGEVRRWVEEAKSRRKGDKQSDGDGTQATGSSRSALIDAAEVMDEIVRAVSENTSMTRADAEKSVRIATEAYFNRNSERSEYNYKTTDKNRPTIPLINEQVKFWQEIAHAIATGTPLRLEPHEIPHVPMSDDVREHLATKWEADLAEVAAGRDPTRLETKTMQTSVSQTITSAAVPPPAAAPELYRNRPRDLKTGRKEFVEAFFARAYAPWIVDGVLTIPREKIRELDPEADFALGGWLNNHKGKELSFKLMETSEKQGPPYTAEQVRRGRAMARWADRHPDEVIGR
jgi:hypothetical protein